ncbi:hypothetical protein, partial [Actinomadura geliboluensis]|uniref:hypothetical protein n=1 Tax=Actinomadura geliboluensis TaxID=882440 RepID=UPI0037112DA3
MWALIAYYLRFCRLQRKLTGDLMGEILNCSKSTVSRLETGALKLDEKQATTLDQAWDTGGIFGFLVWYATLGHDPDWLCDVKSHVSSECMIGGRWKVGMHSRLVLEP